MSEPIITIKNLSKSYNITHESRERYIALRDVVSNGVRKAWKRIRHPFGGWDEGDPCHEVFWALKNVNLEIQKGDRIGIIGRNGAGKSTLLKILSRITHPTAGEIILRGRVASLLEVGTGFHPELTGRKNIYLNGAVLGMTQKEIARKFDEIVEFAGVEKFLDTPVKRYSSGMQVRLGFAVAAHLEPEILVVDEVLAVGDAEFQKKCLGKMEEVSKGHDRTILFVSHNMAAVSLLCNKVVVLKDGAVQFYDTAANGVEKYLRSLLSEDSKKSIEQLSRLRKDFGEDGRIIDAMLYNSAGEKSKILKFCEPYSIKIKYRINSRTVSNFRIGIRFESSAGVYISSTFSPEINFSREGEFEITAQFKDLLLTPGFYNLTFSILSQKRGIDQVVNALNFEVFDVPFLKDVTHKNAWGLVESFPQWTL